ncbi:unnamed protein product [Anisakis simplex]|uniref:Putative nudix hydrolase 1 (inferred by orthology to a C. elegans protein) n=1 Tax=Anisakis simplex TaxID=6269 RepID=A0A0M3JTW7_ANISI|nr:unnamed protein product [Anisakis simplex]
MMGTREEDQQEKTSQQQIIDMQLGRCKYVRVSDNITYIGVGVLLRECHGILELLMVQEAKKRCYGKCVFDIGGISLLAESKVAKQLKWVNLFPIDVTLFRCYFVNVIINIQHPASVCAMEGVCREVLEESGYKCELEELLCMQVQGSGWYRFAFYCNVIGGERKTVADAESLSSNWFPVEDVRAKKIETRGMDFLKIIDDALRYRAWRSEHLETLPRRQFIPVPVSVRGLFIEFLIIRHAKYDSCYAYLFAHTFIVCLFSSRIYERMNSAKGKFFSLIRFMIAICRTKTELLVHHHIEECDQILTSADAFPLAEFGFEYFFAMVVSKCFQHMLKDGRSAIDIPKQITRIECTAYPSDGIEHGLRVRVICLQKWSMNPAQIRDIHRYHWITVSESVMHQLHLSNDQYRPTLYLL